MSLQMARGFCIVYLAGRDSDTPLEIKMLGSDSLDFAIRTARSKVENMAFAGAAAGRAPAGFVIEDSEGHELHRWYRSAC
jgi:hypothetical protein